MIKRTFYNLPEQKRQRIIDAIVEEFSSSSTEKVSINRIVKAANISRGSFYQYFDDKVDLVEVLTKSFVDLSIEGANKALEYSNGDIFYTYEKLFEIITKFAQDKTQKVILKNLLRSLRANDDLVSEYLLNRFNGFEELNKIAKQYNTDNLKFKSSEDVEYLSQILTQLLKNAIFNYFVIDVDYQTVKKTFLRKLEIVKSGAVAQF
ncbi:TetR family transcriptional regulator [Ruminococcus sp. YE282]|jgi:AcrR family transcriptional regulator|uniref:TetR family transcriptional regulator n=1 Tax=Ruminococcus sp. YE282 TaxID=3158780 RepID=UPI0008831DED|nr:TetR family transcriptional regulator [Ruminococcus bromii]MEE3497866.1 TetR family transcriptional regulator [Ruminococcus bromii]SCY55670.1 transcriptional regulator, TetR family [Ruminococcus bromii]HCB95204.1 TetR/AcrR family transcriptional regulator [Ruminococcus sp.]